jgi:hypothetical protein
MTIVWGFIGVRLFDLTQAVVAIGTGSLQESTAPATNLAVFCLLAGESLLLCLWLV